MSTKKIITYDDLDTTKFKVVNNKLSIDAHSSDQGSVKTRNKFVTAIEDNISKNLLIHGEYEYYPDNMNIYYDGEDKNKKLSSLVYKNVNGDLLFNPFPFVHDTREYNSYYLQNGKRKDRDPFYWADKVLLNTSDDGYEEYDENNPNHFVEYEITDPISSEQFNVYKFTSSYFSLIHATAMKHLPEYVEKFAHFGNDHEFDIYNENLDENPLYWLMTTQNEFFEKIINSGYIHSFQLLKYINSSVVNPIVKTPGGFSFNLENFAFILKGFLLEQRSKYYPLTSYDGDLTYKFLAEAFTELSLSHLINVDFVHKGLSTNTWTCFPKVLSSAFRTLALEVEYNPKYRGSIGAKRKALSEGEGYYRFNNKELFKQLNDNSYIYNRMYGDHGELIEGRYIEEPIFFFDQIINSEAHDPYISVTVRKELVENLVYMLLREIEVNPSSAKLLQKLFIKLGLVNDLPQPASIDREEFIRLFNEVLDYQPEPVMESTSEAWQEFVDKQKPTHELIQKLKDRLENNYILGG